AGTRPFGRGHPAGGGLGDVELDAVDGNRRHRLLDVDVDRLLAAERVVGEVRLDRDRVVARDDGLRQARRGKRQRDEREEKQSFFHQSEARNRRTASPTPTMTRMTATKRVAWCPGRAAGAG